MDLSRRSFLKVISTGPLVVVAAKSGLIWTPEQQLDVEPAKELVVANQAIWDGGVVAVYSTKGKLPFVKDVILEDAPFYFSAGTPLLIIVSALPKGRYSLRGDRKALLSAEKAAVLLAWEVGKAWETN